MATAQKHVNTLPVKTEKCSTTGFGCKTQQSELGLLSHETCFRHLFQTNCPIHRLYICLYLEHLWGSQCKRNASRTLNWIKKSDLIQPWDLSDTD